MTASNGQIDAPPPVEVVERFSKETAAVVREQVSMPCDKTSAAIVPLLAHDSKMLIAAIDGVIGERRARIGGLLAELDREFGGLAEDLGLRAWRINPVVPYHRPALCVTRRRVTMSTAAMIADLGDINWSQGGTVNADRPRRQITVKDFARQGVGMYERDLVGAQDPAMVPEIDMRGPGLSTAPVLPPPSPQKR